MSRSRTRLATTAMALALAMGLTLFGPGVTPPVGATVPDAPTGVSAVAGPGRVTLKWDPPPFDGGSPITGYQVTPTRNGVPQPVRSFAGDDTRRGITGLMNGATYTFTVRAVNADGTGAESAPSNAVVPARQPDPVQYVTAVAGNAVATVHWTTSPYDGGSPITGYEVQEVWSGEPVTIYTFPATARSATFTGLRNGHLYRFEVRVVNDVRSSDSTVAPYAVVPAQPVERYRPYTAWGHLLSDVSIQLRGYSPETHEYDRWLPELQAGTKGAGDIVAELRASADHRSNVDPVVRLYQAYYLRMPDQAGLEYWIGQRRGGRSLLSISAFFARSSEFTTLYGSLTDREFVELIYENILGRPGEPAGVDYWTAEITSGRRSRGSVMLGFSESKEYRDDQAAEVTIAVLYLLWLDRPPLAEERAAAVAALDGGQSAAAFAQSLLKWTVPRT